MSEGKKIAMLVGTGMHSAESLYRRPPEETEFIITNPYASLNEDSDKLRCRFDERACIRVAKLVAKNTKRNQNIIMYANTHPQEFGILNDRELQFEKRPHTVIETTVNMGILDESVKPPSIFMPDFPAYQNLQAPKGCEKHSLSFNQDWMHEDQVYVVRFEFEVVSGSLNAFKKKVNSMHTKFIAMLRLISYAKLITVPGITVTPKSIDTADSNGQKQETRH